MPRWGLPLYGQVLSWFFINIALVSVALWMLLRFQYGVSVEDVFAEQLRVRVEPRAELIATDLRGSARDEWAGILASKGEELRVRLAVMTFDGEWAEGAGLPTALRASAEEVVESGRSSERKGEPNDGPRGDGPPRDGPPRDGPPRDGPPRGPRNDRFERDALGGRESNLVENLRRPPLSRPSHQRARVVFSGKGKQGGQWVGVEVYLGGEQFRHPPQAVLTFYAKKDARSEIFVDWRPLVLISLGLLVLSGLVWLPFVHRVTKRLRLMTEGAEKISEGDFKVNVASSRGDEIGRLSRVIQRMSSRLGVLVDGQKRFLGDTAHELCSPLVRIRMGLGVLEQRLDGSDRERLQDVDNEVGELARLVDELLAFSKASLTKGEVGFEFVYLHEFCDEVSQREALGNECLVVGGQGLKVRTNPDLLKRALGNLVRNAARYGEGKPLTVKVEKHGEEVWIGVLDRGPGLPEGWVERAFEPFARPEEARTREAGGAGLGLAIVKTCAESLGGRVFCRNRETGGLEVVLVIPAREG